MSLRRLAGAALLTVATTFAFAAANASAFTGISVGDPVTATLASPTFSIGSFASCTGSTLSGVVASDAGSGSGGEISITSASFSGCARFGSPETWTANALPWQLSVDGLGYVTLAGFDFTERWGLLSCSLRGTLSPLYDQTTGDAVFSGSVTRYSGSSLCASPVGVSGTYNFYDQFGYPVQL